MDFRSEATYKESRLPVELASTLIPDAYRTEEFFAEEQEQIFAKGWVPVAAISEVSEPRQTITRTVAGRSIIVTMNPDGERNAFLNVCRHRGSRLIRQDCSLPAAKIRCPYHAWAYDLDGACIGTPMFEGSDIPEDMQAAFDMTDVKAFDKADYSLHGVRVDAWGPLIFVSLDPDVMPLAQWLGDLPERLGGFELDKWEVRGTKDYDIAANWKLIAENFMEYYHLPWVHPELMKVSRIQDHYRYQGTGMYTGMTLASGGGRKNVCVLFVGGVWWGVRLVGRRFRRSRLGRFIALLGRVGLRLRSSSRLVSPNRRCSGSAIRRIRCFDGGNGLPVRAV